MRLALPLLIVLLAALGCRRTPTPPPAPTPIEVGGLHNVFRVSDRVFSGSGPEGDPDFAAIRALGVRTVLSVDGAAPDVAAAGRHGLRYVHVPVGYDGVPREKALAVAKAVRDADGPVYVHCHHGKHRGPAAVAAAQRCLDPTWTPEFAAAWMTTAGTDPRYAGLFASTRTLTPPDPGEVDRAPDAPQVAPVPDLARRMVEMDATWDRIKAVKAAGWKRPVTHPDLDPPHEALQLAEHYREAGRLAAASARGPEFLALLGEAEAAAADLERALRQTPPTAGPAFDRSASACARCHDRFRDRPGN